MAVVLALRKKIYRRPSSAAGLNDHHFLRDRFHAGVLFGKQYGSLRALVFGGASLSYINWRAEDYTFDPVKGILTQNHVDRYITLNFNASVSVPYAVVLVSRRTSGTGIEFSMFRTDISYWSGICSDSGSRFVSANNSTLDGDVSTTSIQDPGDTLYHAAVALRGTNDFAGSGLGAGIQKDASVSPYTGALSSCTFGVSRRKNNDNPAQAWISFCAIYKGKVSDDELKEVSANVWDVLEFARGRTFILFPVSWGGITQQVGLATETDTCFPISAMKRAAADQAVETDAAQLMTAKRTHIVGQSAEADISQSIAILKRVQVSQPAETDIAQPVTISGQKIVAVGLAVETGSATAITSAKLAAVSLVLESDTSLAAIPMRARVVAQAIESDTATGIYVRRNIYVAQATETDSAPALTVAGQKLIPVGLATEIEVAQAMASAKVAQVGLATETDAGLSVTLIRTIQLGGAAEIDAATATGLVKAVQAGLATETDSALAIIIPGLTKGTKMVFTVSSREIRFTVLR